MNILFVNNSEINPLNSGIQRITAILARGFTARGINCYGAYFENSKACEEILFIEKIKLDFTEESVRQLSRFIQKNQIERIIVQECWPLKKLALVRRALLHAPGCQLFYCYHNKPGKEFVRPLLPVEFYRFITAPDKITSLKKLFIALLPGFIYNYLVRKEVRRNYAFIAQTADKIVLLSESYIPVFLKLSGLPATDNSKFIAIGNCLSFQEDLPLTSISAKQKEIVLVGRLSDRQKRLSTALKIWQKVEKSGNFKDWKLKIVGNGPDEKYYHHLARQLKLQQIHFEGKQDPLPYYQRASIYMLTSAYEGFPLVLTESLQMGVVPIAFDSFSSIHDVLRNHENGIIIPPANTSEFLRQLQYLMKNPEERNKMARTGLESCKHFSEENIVQIWINHLNGLSPKADTQP